MRWRVEWLWGRVRVAVLHQDGLWEGRGRGRSGVVHICPGRDWDMGRWESCPAGWVVGGGCGVVSFLSSEGLGYGARGNHVQQVLPLAVSQTGPLVAPNVAWVQVGDVHPWREGVLRDGS